MTTLASHASSPKHDVPIVRALLDELDRHQRGIAQRIALWALIRSSREHVLQLRADWNSAGRHELDDATLLNRARQWAADAARMRALAAEARTLVDRFIIARHVLVLADLIEDMAETFALSANPELRIEIDRAVTRALTDVADTTKTPGGRNDWRRELAKL